MDRAQLVALRKGGQTKDDVIITRADPSSFTILSTKIVLVEDRRFEPLSTSPFLGSNTQKDNKNLVKK